MAPGPDGSVYVAISAREGPAMLVLLDPRGRPRPGWPVAMNRSTMCGPPLPLPDGSVRIVCDGTDLPRPDDRDADVRAFSFDANGRAMDGWPVQLVAPSAYGIGRDFTAIAERRSDDPSTGETLLHEAVMTTVDAAGAVRIGAPLGLDVNRFGDRWAIGPDGVAYSVRENDEDAESSVITAVDSVAVRAGWPVTIDGFGSITGFGSEGPIAVLLGSAKRHTSHLAVLVAGGKVVTSGVLHFPTAERTGDTGGCTVSEPRAPLVARNGAIFLYSQLDRVEVFSLSPSLTVAKGWPFEPVTSLATARPGLEFEHEAGYCPTPVVPQIGPDGTLVLSLKARTPKVGGSLVAVGQDGQVRAGWPVELKRAGAEFWSIAAGPDGTTYALAIEPETGGKSSASILAIAPDSTVRYTTTIIEP